MKRYKKECPNPLFEKWLEEWKEEAKTKDSPLQFAFGKALMSLRKYPLTLASGKECAILQHFGKKLCDMLDKKLEKHKMLSNIPSTSAQPNFLDNNEKEQTDKKKLQERKNGNSNTKNQKIKNYQMISNNPYIPKVGSAAYAILITMYNKMQEASYPGFMSKNDIIQEARNYSDCPMKNSAANHYSGWSSMTTLIQKNFVIKRSSPAKYILTDSGIALAIALLDGSAKHFSNLSDDYEHLSNSLNNKTCYNTSPVQKIRNSELSFDLSNDIHDNVTTSFRKLEFLEENQNRLCYLDDVPKNTEPSDKKSNDLKDADNNKSDKEVIKKTANRRFNVTEDKSTTSNKYNDLVTIDDDDDYDLFKLNKTVNTDFEKKEVDQIEIKFTCSSEDFNELCKENAEPVITVRKEQKHFIFAETLTSDTSSIAIKEKKDEVYSKEIINNTECKNDKKSKKIIDQRPVEEITSKNQNQMKNLNAMKSKKKAPFEELSESFFLLPNNFDIILLVDTQETSGGKTRPKDDPAISELIKTGVLFEVRSLNVGDFTWIARCRLTNRELILPYIIERKRWDDLSSSIKDGRYHEQKFRLKRCGIENLIYMIENCGMNHFGSLPATTLFQAAVNSLVQDDFCVKYTKDLKDSMRYLAVLTNMFIKNYTSKELRSCKKVDLETKDSVKSSELLMEFDEFNKAAVKTKNYNVREMFIRQLLQLKGLSVEKALAIVEIYPTPKILINALRTADDKLLAMIQTGPSKRKLGPIIGKTLYQFYTNYNLV